MIKVPKSPLLKFIQVVIAHKFLRDADPSLRAEAVLKLGALESTRSIEKLILLYIQDNVESVRKQAEEALLNILKRKRAFSELCFLLQHEDWDVRKYASKLLAENIEEANDKTVISKALIQSLSDRSRNVRMYSAKALGKLGDPQAVAPLINCLSDQDGEVREAVVEALGNIKDTRAIKPLISALNDSWGCLTRDKGVLGKTLKSLREIGKPIIEPLIDGLKDKHTKVRMYSAKLLGEMKDSHSLDPLVAAMWDISSDVRFEAARALDKIGWKPSTDTEKAVYLVAKRNWDECINMGESAIEPLINSLKQGWLSTEPWLPVLVLGELGNPRAIKPLIKALEDNIRSFCEELHNWHEDQDYYGSMEEAAESIELALSQIGHLAIEPLIDSMREANIRQSDEGFSHFGNLLLGKLRRILTAITGMDEPTDLKSSLRFNDEWENHEKWSKWWKENKDRFENS